MEVKCFVRVNSKHRLLEGGFYLGLGVPEDKKEGLRRWNLVAQAGKPLSKAHGLFFSEAMVSEGDAAAQNMLGDCYYYGFGVAEDKKRVRAMVTLVCCSGRHSLGNCNEKGLGVVKSE